MVVKYKLAFRFACVAHVINEDGDPLLALLGSISSLLKQFCLKLVWDALSSGSDFMFAYILQPRGMTRLPCVGEFWLYELAT